jgi:hypothetical protein
LLTADYLTGLPAMAVVDQKKRYRRQAALCYDVAATMTGERAISMIRLGDTYAALAVDPHRTLPNVSASRKKICRSDLQEMRTKNAIDAFAAPHGNHAGDAGVPV